MPVQSAMWWKQYANNSLSPIERTKDELRISIDSLRKNHPEWERNNDARWAWVTGIKKVLQNTQVSLVFIKLHMTEPIWWQKTGVQNFNPSEIPEHIKEFEVGARIVLIQLTFSVLEDTLRSITGALYPTDQHRATQNFHNVYQHLLARTSLAVHEPLFDCYSVIRNMIHTNGTFYPQSDGDRKFEIDELVSEVFSLTNIVLLKAHNLVTDLSVTIIRPVNLRLLRLS